MLNGGGKEWVCYNGKPYDSEKNFNLKSRSSANISGCSNNVRVRNCQIEIDSSDSPHIKWESITPFKWSNGTIPAEAKSSITYVYWENDKWVCVNGVQYSVDEDSNLPINDAYIHTRTVNQYEKSDYESSYFILDKDDNLHFVWDEYNSETGKYDCHYMFRENKRWCCIDKGEVVEYNPDSEQIDLDTCFTNNNAYEYDMDPMVVLDRFGYPNICWSEYDDTDNKMACVAFIKSAGIKYSGNIYSFSKNIRLDLIASMPDELSNYHYTKFVASSDSEDVEISHHGSYSEAYIPCATIKVDLEDIGISPNTKIDGIKMDYRKSGIEKELPTEEYERILLGFRYCLPDEDCYINWPEPKMKNYEPRISHYCFIDDSIRDDRKATIFVPLVRNIRNSDDGWEISYIDGPLTFYFVGSPKEEIENDEKKNMLIVSSNEFINIEDPDKEYIDLSEYAQWKKDVCGIDTECISIEDIKKEEDYAIDDPNEIKRYLRNQKEKDGKCTYDYVFLVGSKDLIPTFTKYYQGKNNPYDTDFPYYLLDVPSKAGYKASTYNDVFIVGRLSVSNKDTLSGYLLKVMEYQSENICYNPKMLFVLNRLEKTEEGVLHTRELFDAINNDIKNIELRDYFYIIDSGDDIEFAEEETISRSIHKFHPAYLHTIGHGDESTICNYSTDSLQQVPHMYSTCCSSLSMTHYVNSSHIMYKEDSKCITHIGSTSEIPYIPTLSSINVIANNFHSDFIKILLEQSKPNNGYSCMKSVGDIHKISKYLHIGKHYTFSNKDIITYKNQDFFAINLLGDPSIVYCPDYEAKRLLFTFGEKEYRVDFSEESEHIDVAPDIINDRTLLPARYVVEPLGGDVSWDPKTKKVACSLNGISIELWVDKPIARVDGREIQIDSDNLKVTPTLIDGRTMVPVRFLAESLGCKVGWFKYKDKKEDKDTIEIIVTYCP